jgi:metal-dependent amidase/aminoacylase/carboxypeptidase family protein
VPIRPQAAALLAGQLRGFGYNVTEHVGKYPKPEWQGHGIVALMKNGAGPTVLVRADMDALPVEEQTGLPYVKDQWHGTLVLIGQPFEETIDGARAMLADGLYSHSQTRLRSRPARQLRTRNRKNLLHAGLLACQFHCTGVKAMTVTVMELMKK